MLRTIFYLLIKPNSSIESNLILSEYLQQSGGEESLHLAPEPSGTHRPGHGKTAFPSRKSPRSFPELPGPHSVGKPRDSPSTPCSPHTATLTPYPVRTPVTVHHPAGTRL